MSRGALLIVALTWAGPALAQGSSLIPRSYSVEPELQLGQGNFALPVIEYRAPDGSWKRSNGIIIGHDLAPNASVGVGFFRMKPKFQDPTIPTAGKSKKVALGFSFRF